MSSSLICLTSPLIDSIFLIIFFLKKSSFDLKVIFKSRLFTLFKFSELSGLRPSYVTIHDVPKVGETNNISESKKPFFYIYLRSNWAFFIVIPSFLMFLINIISNPSLEKLIFLIAILSVPILLTYSIVLERYFIHCSSLLACLFLPLFSDIKNTLRKK